LQFSNGFDSCKNLGYMPSQFLYIFLFAHFEFVFKTGLYGFRSRKIKLVHGCSDLGFPDPRLLPKLECLGHPVELEVYAPNGFQGREWRNLGR
jgi:hypothetical protein